MIFYEKGAVFLKVCVLAGGFSSEREVSLLSGGRVAAAVRELGHDAFILDPAFPCGAAGAETEPRVFEGGERRGFGREIIPYLTAADAVFFALHGGAGEDGRLKALCSLLGVRATGNGYAAEAAAMDKLFSKAVYAASGVKTPKWARLKKDGGAPFLPAVVKPAGEGSSAGVFICKTEADFSYAAKKAARFGEIFAEEYIKGREISVSVLFGEPLPPVEIIPSGEFYDFGCKYKAGGAKEVCPAPVSEGEAKAIKEAALAAHRALGLTAVSRSDFILTEAGEVFCLETNASPGMTERSLLPMAAEAAGLSFTELCGMILERAK